LVQERGRIKKITRNISEFFGYAKEEMVGFNINLFMPSLYGKYHAQFLSNFIDKGRIKLLKERARVVFAKNKRKFIFPINIKLKT
jgi:PAS domain S-box-containing protein